MKDVFVNIRMTAEMKAKITEMAKSECRSVSGQISLMLSQQLDTQGVHTQKRYVPTQKEYKPRVTTDLPEGVSEQTWHDFKALRNAKKAPITARAIEGIAKEAMNAGMTLEAALRECCSRGWTGFKADWVRSKQDEVAALLKPSVPYLEM